MTWPDGGGSEPRGLPFSGRPSEPDELWGRRDVLGLLAAAAVTAGTGGVGVGALNRRLTRRDVELFVRYDEFMVATQSPVAGDELAVAVAAPSVERGGTVEVAGLAATARRVDLALFRVAWNDGAGTRTMAEQRSVEIGPDLAGIARIALDPSWSSGLYLIAIRTTGGGSWERVVPFVVTDRTSTAPVLVQIPLATYQAYNAWGGASLYDFNSPVGRAPVVRLDRPFEAFDGGGFMYYGDLHLVWWLEREGIDVAYASSLDVHRDPTLMDRHRLFLSCFHDEYWSPQMRRHLEAWLAAGRNAAFLSSNNIYWQVDFGNDGDGHPVMYCNKVDGAEQGRFRRSGWPEHALLGSSYESYRFPYGTAAADWVVAGCDHWLYDGTGLRDGDRIGRLVGYVWDRLPRGGAAEGVTVVADSPLADGQRHHACVVELPGGGTVFNAGTNYWPRLLLGSGHWSPDRHVSMMTRNLIDRLS